MTILVFDIETVPDVESGRKLYNLTDLDDKDVAQAMFSLRKEKTGTTFLPHYLQKIVAISLVLANKKQIKVWSLGEENSAEEEIISRFFNGINKHTPMLVSWNGAGFDLPVLHYRSLKHGIDAENYWEIGEQQQTFRWNNYLNRFHYRHLDLMDVLAAYQNKAFAPLDEIATMLGFPGKMGMSGDKVWDTYQAGDLQAIRNYCETDVLNTYGVYLRFELIRGNLNHNEFNSEIQRLRDYLESENKEHLLEFLKAIDV